VTIKRVIFVSAGVIALLLAAAAGVGVWVVRSGWLTEKIRAGIVAEAEKATGGKVDLGALRLNWRTRVAEIDHLVIHGTEAVGQAPLLAIDRVRVTLRILSIVQRDVAIEQIEADRPVAHLIIYPDGKINLPRPKTRRKPVPEVILDLKIARIDLRDGAILEESPGGPVHVIPVRANGENVTARVTYDVSGARYSGDVSLHPLHLAWKNGRPLDVRISASAAMERNRIVVSAATLTTSESVLNLKNAVLNDFTAPVIGAQYDGRISLGEIAGIFQRGTKPSGSVSIAGQAQFAAPNDYRVSGNVRGSGIAWEDLRGVTMSANVEAGPEKIVVNGARVSVRGGQIAASGEIRGLDKFHASGSIERFGARAVAALVTKQTLPYDGLVSGSFEADGRLRDLSSGTASGSARLRIAPAAAGAAVQGEIAVRYDAAAKKIELGQSWLELPHTRIDVSGTVGERLKLKLESQDPGDLVPAIDKVATGAAAGITYKSLSFTGEVSGALANPQVTGHAAAESLNYKGQQVDSMSGDLAASGTGLTVHNGAIVANGIHGRVEGTVGLADWTASAASAVSAFGAIDNADLGKILALAGHKETEVSGTLNATSRISGTLGDVRGAADLALNKGSIYQQPYDSITGHAQLTGKGIESMTGLFVSGPKRVNMSGHFERAGSELPAGRLDFNLTSNTMPLNQIALIRQRQPDIRGFGAFHTTGALQLGYDTKHQVQVNLLDLTAEASANSLELGGRNLGDARFTAQTKNGVVTGRFDSNAASATVHGEGSIELTGDYPVKGRLTFNNVGLNALAALIVKEGDAGNLKFDGTAEGELTIAGLARKPDQFTASLNVARVEVKPLPNTDLARSLPNFALINNGPVRVAMTKSQLRIESARFRAPQTDFTIDGTIALSQQAPLDVRVRGDVNLALVTTLNPDLTSSGALAIDASVRGGWQTPNLAGRAVIRNGGFRYSGYSNGLSNASGEVVFNGTRATIQSFTAESGGGKVEATGFAAITNGVPAFRIETKTEGVRVRYPEGVSSVSDARLTFAGTSQRSEASGAITVHRVSINPRADAAAILANTASPVNTPPVATGLVSNVNLDIQVETAPDVVIETSLTQSIQADANLRVRGTAASPALLGRINITQGGLIFFGNKYSINQGMISFFNPAKIDPILNVDLETKARGVDVIITVSGPINKLNMNYRSDPPLQFADIVALLATGRTPTDPTLAVRDTGQSQTFQDLGASALLGAAIANPVGGRLQRFFGVSRIKIDPQLTGVTGSPEARLTVEQQVTPEILFTYITDVASTSTQLIRVEWSLNRQWSAILIREENGYVGLDFAYKKRFR
jgi:translocation and assembly module TamB